MAIAARSLLEMEYAETTVAWAREALELTDIEISHALRVDRKTIQRWRDHQSVPSVTHRRQMEKLNQLRHLIETSFRSPHAAQRWLHAPSRGLGGRTPIALLAGGDTDAIISLLGTLAAGAFR